MKIKRFFAPDTRQAIRMVREDQGPDAVILSNRRVKGGIEIIAAVDYDESIFAEVAHQGRTDEHEKTESSPGEVAQTKDFNSTNAVHAPESPAVEWAQDPAIVEMRHEIQNLRGILENQLSHLAWGEMARSQPTQAKIVHQLMEMGIAAEISNRVAAQIEPAQDADHAWRQALACLSRQLIVTDDDILTHGGVVALVGPTGVGKTTTVAKLAARFTLRHGQHQVALISTDSYRIGAHEQLLTYGRILGVPAYVAEDPEELQSKINDLSDKRLILIDTAGMSHRDMRLSKQLSALNQGSPAVRIYLALSANTQFSALNEIVNAFRSVPLAACILTKLDEATSLGGVLSALLENQLPLAYVSDGQRVPEDMHPARAHRLISNAATLMKQTKRATANSVLPQALKEKMANAHV